jgi:hypothetical protein
LAEAANRFLDSLYAGAVPETADAPPITERTVSAVPGSISSEEEEQLLLDTNIWVLDQGLPEGEMMYELVQADTGDPVALLDLAWPDGLQHGLSQPVALLIDEGEDTLSAANKAGFRCFADAESFRSYVKSEVLAQE